MVYWFPWAEKITQFWLSPEMEAMPRFSDALLVPAPLNWQYPWPLPEPFTNCRLMLDCTDMEMTRELLAVVCAQAASDKEPSQMTRQASARRIGIRKVI